MPVFTDLTGQRFGRLQVLSRAPSYRNKSGLMTMWLCRCDCGKTTKVIPSSLHGGRTRSCGCLRIEGLRERRLTHGYTQNRSARPEYSSWQAMRARCLNPNHQDYSDYGGRGIKVSKRWDKFENFLADMGPKPEGYTVERINNDGNYTPNNCKWDSRANQAKNRRKRSTRNEANAKRQLSQELRQLPCAVS